MKLQIALDWEKNNRNKAKPFREPTLATLFDEYKKRIQAFIPVELNLTRPQRSKDSVLWVCDSRAVALSSKDLSKKIQKVLNSGKKTWNLSIGGPDGFTTEQLDADFVWSLGPMTLPHELATVVLAEQIYRGFCILHNHPYHSGH